MSISSNITHHLLRKALPFVCVVAWGSIIFWFSNQPNLTIVSDDFIDFILRKMAHMLVFGVFLSLVWWMITWTLNVRHKIWRPLFALTLTLAYASLDEWHQTFVRGRVGHPQDVIIDMIGATLILILLIIFSSRREVNKEP